MLRIEIPKEGLESLRGNPRQYVRAKLTEDDGAVYETIGVRLRGSAGSFRGIDDARPGFTIGADFFTKPQTFHGMEKFHLNNSAQDGSFLSEMTCGELYRSAGVPASRFTHAIVALNDRLCGFYALKEGYDSGFLDVHFGNHDGNFYDGGFLTDIDQELRCSPGKEDVKDRADLKAMVEACRVARGNGDEAGAARLEAMSKRLDLPRFISYACLQVLTCDWDGYPAKSNNYRVYHDPKPDKVVFIPSGMDQMFADTGYPLLPGFGGMVAQKLFNCRDAKAQYVKRMKEILRDVFVEDHVIKYIDEAAARVRAAIKPADDGFARNVAGQIEGLKERIAARMKNVAEQAKHLA